jgi:hypothetical protein
LLEHFCPTNELRSGMTKLAGARRNCKLKASGDVGGQDKTRSA